MYVVLPRFGHQLNLDISLVSHSKRHGDCSTNSEDTLDGGTPRELEKVF